MVSVVCIWWWPAGVVVVLWRWWVRAAACFTNDLVWVLFLLQQNAGWHRALPSNKLLTFGSSPFSWIRLAIYFRQNQIYWWYFGLSKTDSEFFVLTAELVGPLVTRCYSRNSNLSSYCFFRKCKFDFGFWKLGILIRFVEWLVVFWFVGRVNHFACFAIGHFLCNASRIYLHTLIHTRIPLPHHQPLMIDNSAPLLTSCSSHARLSFKRTILLFFVVMGNRRK